jgi:hypothetical protein
MSESTRSNNGKPRAEFEGNNHKTLTILETSIANRNNRGRDANQAQWPIGRAATATGVRERGELEHRTRKAEKTARASGFPRENPVA